MVDELELLKKDWQKREVDLPKLSYEQIYPMTKKKSSSITFSHISQLHESLMHASSISTALSHPGFLHSSNFGL